MVKDAMSQTVAFLEGDAQPEELRGGEEQLLHRNANGFRGLVSKADRLLYHSTLGLRMIKRETDRRSS